MAKQVISFGAALVFVDSVELGYTRNGVDFTDEGYFIDVPGDEFGGDEGPPIDIQFLGTIARFRCEFTKYDSAVAAQLAGRVNGAQAGTVTSDNGNPPGTFLFQEELFYSVKLQNPNGGELTFPRAIIRNPIEINKGTKFSTLIMEVEGHRNTDGRIYI
jgi:hypothetical protein